jgi:pimeloyl-ACP methyl ester carboxylesterase
MLALLDDVGWADCSLVGYSVGGPFALAAAAALGERARRVALISSVGRADLGTSGPLKLLAGLAHRAPALIGQGYPPFERLLLRQAAVLRLAGLFSPSMDRTALGKGWVRAAIGNNGRLAFERGGAGALDDLLAISADWGQLTNEIDCAVRLWHGEDDHLVPPGPARALAGELSQGSFTLVPDAGHMMVFELAPVIANWLSRAL